MKQRITCCQDSDLSCLTIFSWSCASWASSTSEGESVSVDLQIDSKKGDRVLLSALPGQVSLTVAEAGKLSCLLRDASRHLVRAQRDRAPAERAR